VSYCRLLTQTEKLFSGDDHGDADKVTRNSSSESTVELYPEQINANFTKVADLEEEREVMSLLKRVLLFLLRKAEAETSLEQDLEILCSEELLDW